MRHCQYDKVMATFHLVHQMNVEQCQVATWDCSTFNPQTKPTYLNCGSSYRLLSYHAHHNLVWVCEI